MRAAAAVVGACPASRACPDIIRVVLAVRPVQQSSALRRSQSSTTANPGADAPYSFGVCAMQRYDMVFAVGTDIIRQFNFDVNALGDRGLLDHSFKMQVRSKLASLLLILIPRMGKSLSSTAGFLSACRRPSSLIWTA